MSTHSKLKGKGKVKRSLLRGIYSKVPSPWGPMLCNVEVYLETTVRVVGDGQSLGVDTGIGGGGCESDYLRRAHEELEREVQRITERINCLVEAQAAPSASLEKVAQAELFEGLEGGR